LVPDKILQESHQNVPGPKIQVLHKGEAVRFEASVSSINNGTPNAVSSGLFRL